MSDRAADDRITVYSDYVCPFCYLGRQSLARYQEQREEDLAIDWHPFDLRARKRGPDGEIDQSVEDGKDEEYYAQARENVERLREKYDAEMAQSTATGVDSLNAQLASYHASQQYPHERWLAFDVAVFEALWQDGRDIGDVEVLADVAEEAGIDPDAVREAVADEALREEVERLFEEAHERGVTGVPTFAYDGYAARGAVPPEQLERLVEGG
jgi:predicted DsbA family dithiol-disulfide isomerase